MSDVVVKPNATASADTSETTAAVQIKSETQGFIAPRMTTTQRDNIASPANGLLIYNTTTTRYEEYTGSTWQAAGGGGGSTLPVADTTSIVEGSVDATKEFRLEVDGLTTATVRVGTVPDRNFTLGTIAVQEEDGTPSVSAVDTIKFTNGTVTDNADGSVSVNIAAGSGMTSFNVTGDTGTPETIVDGNTLDIAGGTGIDTAVGATDTVTVSIDGTVATLAGAQTLTNKTLTTPTIGDFTNATHDHSNTANGGTLPASTIASGTLAHERGGLEADVSAFSGLLKIAAGATSQAVANTDYAAATHASRHITGAADEIDGDKLDIDYTPTNYTPSIAPAEADNLDNLTAHLSGIDTALAGGGGGATIVSASDWHLAGTSYTITSTSFVDVDATNAAITLTLNGSGDCIVTFSFHANKSTGGSMFFRITDGTNTSDEVEFDVFAFPAVNLRYIFTSTSSGSTTYKLQAKSSDGNNVLVAGATAIIMTALEIS